MWDVLNRDRLNDNGDCPPKAAVLAYFIYIVGVVIKLLPVLDKMSFKVCIFKSLKLPYFEFSSVQFSSVAHGFL